MKIGGSISGAIFSDDNRRFRYALWRIWDKSPKCLSRLFFIGLNPSTANGTKDDPTIRRLIGFAKAWGFGGLYAGNLFSLVTTEPAALSLGTSSELPGGPNDTAIKQMRDLSAVVLVGWGAWGQYAGTRPAEVLAVVGEPVYCLKTTKAGEPTHPLYLSANSKLTRYYRKGLSTGN